jgi:hypothetical protein
VDSAGSEAPPRRGRHARPRGGTSRLFRWHGTILSLVAYLFVAFLANKNVWVHGFAHTLQATGGNDTGEEVWFLAQTPWAIVHGINPFANTWLNAPVGIDLMDNTTMPLLGVLGAPITFLFGPIATMNVMIALGFSASAMAFFVMARRFTSWWPAAFVGGLLYGFSPFAVAEASSHVFLVFNVVPPLMILVIHRFVISGYRSPWLYGAALGGCYLAQFYISAEAFASLVVISLIAVIVGGALVIGRLDIDVTKIAKMGVVAAVVAILGVGYGAWVALEGPQHIHGPAQPAVAIAGISSDPAGLVVPTDNQHFTFNEAARGDAYVAQRDANWHVLVDATLENGTYVGIPLLLVLIAGVIVLRRNRFAVFAAVMAAVTMLLSMGSYLHVDGHRTPVPLPFIVLAHLPLFDSGSAARYVGLFWLFAALLLVMTLDWVYQKFVPRIRAGWSAVVCLLVAALALVPLVPAWPYPSGTAVVPHWFTTNARALPVGTTAVIFPSSNPGDSSAMLWQAMSDMTFRMPGGYAVFASSPSGTASFYAAPSVLQNAMTACVSGVPPQISPEETRTVLHGWRAGYVVVVPGTNGAACATELFDEALGAHHTEGGVSVWSTGAAG